MSKQTEIDLKEIIGDEAYETRFGTTEISNKGIAKIQALIDTACVEAVQGALANSATPKAHTKQVDNRSELKRLEGERVAIKELQDKAESKFKASHKHQVGDPVMINNQPATIKYLFVRYKDGLPEISENYERDPVWNDKDKDFDIYSSSSDKPEYLVKLSETELERLQELNELWYMEYQTVDSKTKIQELESERQKLLPRCGHKFSHDYRLFSDFQKYVCDKCYYTLETPQ